MSLSQAHDLESKSRTKDVFIEQDCTFSTMLLPDSILQGLENAGFKRPSPIQLAAIPLARCGFDLIVQAKSGTGKTLVFTIAALESIKFDVRRVQVIIMAPTREIALQIGDVIQTVGSAMKGLKVGVFVGGRPLDQDKLEARSCNVAVGAPGRVRHLIEMNALDPQAVRLLVLDEADRLFGSDVSFHQDINYVFHKCGESKQMLAVSATYPPELLEFTQRYMRSGRLVTPATDPSQRTDSSGPCVLVGLRQLLAIVPDHPDGVARLRRKEAELFRLLETVSFDQACVFLNYASRAESLNNILLRKGFSSVVLTSKKDMETRQNSVASLKKGLARILVCTDLAARGLDAASVNLVVNTELPRDSSTYLHRMGRAGRFGGLGLCISIVCDGMELERFRNLLGGIGGASMFVSIVPKYQKVDLWKEDLENLDRVYGKPFNEDDEETDSMEDFEEKEIVRSPKVNTHITGGKGFLDLTKNVHNDSTSESLISFTDLQKQLQTFLDERKNVNLSKSEDVEQKSNAEEEKSCDVPRKYLSYSDAVTKNLAHETKSVLLDLGRGSNVAHEDGLTCDNVAEEMDTSLKKRKRSVSEISQSEVDSCMMTASGIDLNSADDDNFSTVSIIDGDNSDSGGDFDSDSSPSAVDRVSSSSLSSYASENEESTIPQLHNSIIFHKTTTKDHTVPVEYISSEPIRRRQIKMNARPTSEVRSLLVEPQIHFSSQTSTDWCSYISKQIENYVAYCRQFNERNFEG